MNEEFEKWARDKGYPFCEVVPAYGPASAMSTTEMRYSEMARVAWQASRKQAVEEVLAVIADEGCDYCDVRNRVLAMQQRD